MLNVFLNYLFFRNNQWDNSEVVVERRWKKLKQNIDYAYKNVPFYRERFLKFGIKPEDINSIEDIQKIPITTKTDILSSDLSYISEEYRDDDLYTSKTSGSTGEPFVSYFDKRGWSILKYASKYRAREACGFSFYERFVIIEAMSVDEANKKNSSVKFSNKVIKRKYLSVYDSVDSHFNFYEKFKPTTLYGFPSYFVNLILYLRENNLRMDYVKRIFTSSEVLSETTRKLIEDFFGCSVNDIYGSTETKEVAWECPQHEGYHINEDLVYVECVDENGNPVGYGETGQIVMTSLENRAMPLLRYSIGDVGMILNERCSCGRGFKLMRPVYGRMVDYFTLKDGRKISPYEITMSMENIEGILQYQILQKSISRVEVNLKVSKKFESSSKNKIVSNLKKILGNDSDLILNFVDKFETSSERGKFRIVKSEVENGVQS